MKFIATILMILTLFLVGQPVCSAASGPEASTESCCGSAGCADDAQPEDKGDHEEDCKGCNPFQSCACCGAGMLNAPLVVLRAQEQPPFFEKAKRCEASRDLLSVDPSGFWQPPRQA